MRPGDLAELVRLPAALSVPGDGWAGAAHVPTAGPGWAMPLSSTLLYWSGMALNDWCDREVDALERPERPIPSGRISATAGLGVAAGLGLAGLIASAAVGGPRALRVSVPLAALVATYDAVAKDSPLGPLVMASTRGLDVLLGAHTDPAAAWQPALAMTAHTTGLTALSRGEVHGGSPAVARAVTAGTLAVAAGTALAAVTDRRTSAAAAAATVGLAGAYAAVVGRAQARAVGDPSAATVRTATRTGIGGFTLLQAAWLARRGRLTHAAALVAAKPLIGLASRRLSTT